MTEEEKELEQKIKQYQYEKEEAERKLEQLYKDTHTKKKSFIFKINRAIGRTVFLWSGLGFLIIGCLLIFAITNLINGLNSFDAVKNIEDRYGINLKSISREVDGTTLIYKVKLSKWKYRKVQPTVVREGMTVTYDDIADRCIKHIIENIKSKDMLDGFEIIETYQKYDILEYNVIYKIKEGESKEKATNKVLELQNYVLNYDKINKKIIKNINKKIKLVETDNQKLSKNSTFFM